MRRFRDLVTRFYSIDRRLEGRQAMATGLLGMLSVIALGGAVLLYRGQRPGEPKPPAMWRRSD